MDQIKVNIKTEVVGIKATCIHCNKEMQDGDCNETEEVLVVNLTAYKDEDSMVLKDVECPLCGSNTFIDVLAYIKVVVE